MLLAPDFIPKITPLPDLYYNLLQLRLFVLVQLRHDLRLRRLPPARILPEQRLLIAPPDDGLARPVVRLDGHPDRVAVVAVRRHLARREDLPHARHGGVPLLAPAVSVASLIDVHCEERNGRGRHRYPSTYADDAI